MSDKDWKREIVDKITANNWLRFEASEGNIDIAIKDIIDETLNLAEKHFKKEFNWLHGQTAKQISRLEAEKKSMLEMIKKWKGSQDRILLMMGVIT